MRSAKGTMEEVYMFMTLFASILFGIPPLVKIAQCLFFRKTMSKVSYEDEWDFETELYEDEPGPKKKKGKGKG